MTPRRALAVLGVLARVDEAGDPLVVFPGLWRELAAAGLVSRRHQVDLDGLRALAFRVDWSPHGREHCREAGRR